MAYTDIDTDILFAKMFGAAREDAGGDWSQIKGVFKIELKTLSRQIKEIGKAVALGEMTEAAARAFMRAVRQSMAMLVAATTILTFEAAERIVMSSLEAVDGMVNGAVGFALI